MTARITNRPRKPSRAVRVFLRDRITKDADTLRAVADLRNPKAAHLHDKGTTRVLLAVLGPGEPYRTEVRG